MKKYIILVLCIFLLSGCTNKYQKNYDLGIKYLEEGDYENAIISLNAAIEIEPKEEAYLALADAYTKQEDYENVILALNAAIEINPSEETYSALAQAYYNLGNQYLEQGDYENAISYLESSADINPNEEAYLELADIYFETEEYDLAIQNYNNALSANSDCEDAKLGLIFVYDKIDDFVNEKLSIKMYRDEISDDKQYLVDDLLPEIQEHDFSFNMPIRIEEWSISTEFFDDLSIDSFLANGHIFDYSEPSYDNGKLIGCDIYLRNGHDWEIYHSPSFSSSTNIVYGKNWEYEYNKYGELIRANYSSGIYIVYEYDENGKIKERIGYNENDAPSDKICFIYTDGVLSSKTHYYYDETGIKDYYFSTQEIRCDEYGRVIYELSYEEDGPNLVAYYYQD